MSKSEDYIEIEVCVSTSKHQSEVKKTFSIDREEWETMDHKEKDEMMLELMFELISWDWNEKE